MRITPIVAFVLALSVFGPAGAQPTPYPDFSCLTLAHRQALTGAPGMTFRVLKMTYTHGAVPLPHKHIFNEIVYLLSGSGTNTMNGKTTALTSDSALIVPAGVTHAIVPSGSGDVTVLSVQFAGKTSPAWIPKTQMPSVCKD